MNKNNLLFTYFKALKDAYAEGNMDSISQYARCLAQLATDNPFIYDTPEHEEFFQIKRNYDLWAKGGVGSKLSYRQMVQHAVKLCEINPKNPYRFDKAAEEAELKAAQEEEKKRVEAVIRNIETKEPLDAKEPEPTQNQTKKTSWIKSLFSRKDDE